ncbi:DUF2535 family protein [Bacillus sp. FJAT-42376]|uniref:DUF2535 family protein n=1 Tax=Bacillus sp. FJAT-42376 TaxID=2014076 RepID=UPI000F4EF05A|nr:DUF2535 family protein [Bacillus sp. FJAT-42376]AZB43247.1 DUF2535 family protein [Bacillus sp. FJAT-42376]
MLFKSLEFKRMDGQKVKVVEIPVMVKDSRYTFLIQARLQAYLTRLHAEPEPRSVYSFRDYLKKVLKWPEYEAIFQSEVLQNNA